MSDPVSGGESRPRCIDDPSRPCHNDLGSHGPREIHDHPVSGDPLDLDAIEARTATAERGIRFHSDVEAHAAWVALSDVPALVAEVRRLRALVEAEPETWGDGNPRVPGESFDDYNARMIEGINNIPDDQLARHPDGTLDTEPACWCNVPAMLAIMRCPRHLGYFP